MIAMLCIVAIGSKAFTLADLAFFPDDKASQGITVQAGKDNVVICIGTGTFPITDSTLASDTTTPFWIYQYTGKEPPFNGKYFLSSGQKAAGSTMPSIGTPLTVMEKGFIYYIHSDRDLHFRCGNGLSATPQQPANAQSNGNTPSGKTCTTMLDCGPLPDCASNPVSGSHCIMPWSCVNGTCVANSESNSSASQASSQQTSGGSSCMPIDCAAPMFGCRYVNPTTDANGCPVSCGTLTCSNGSASSMNNHAAAPSLTITALVPSSGPIGTRVIVNGTGFAPTGNIIHFSDSTFDNLNSPDGTHLLFTVPDHNIQPCEHATPPCEMNVHLYPAGQYPVTVQIGNDTSNASTFTITGNTSIGDASSASSCPAVSCIPNDGCVIVPACSTSCQETCGSVSSAQTSSGQSSAQSSAHSSILSQASMSSAASFGVSSSASSAAHTANIYIQKIPTLSIAGAPQVAELQIYATGTDNGALQFYSNDVIHMTRLTNGNIYNGTWSDACDFPDACTYSPTLGMGGNVVVELMQNSQAQPGSLEIDVTDTVTNQTVCNVYSIADNTLTAITCTPHSSASSQSTVPDLSIEQSSIGCLSGCQLTDTAVTITNASTTNTYGLNTAILAPAQALILDVSINGISQNCTQTLKYNTYYETDCPIGTIAPGATLTVHLKRNSVQLLCAQTGFTDVSVIAVNTYSFKKSSLGYYLPQVSCDLGK